MDQVIFPDAEKIKEALAEILSLARYDWRKGIGSFGNCEKETEETITILLSQPDLFPLIVGLIKTG